MSRQVFSALGLFLFMLMAGASQAVVPPPGKANTVRLTAPPIPQAVPLLWASESRIFHEMGTQAIFIPWRSPEQLHTFVATGKVDAVITTLSTVSSLVNKGIPCRVLAVYSAPLWVVTNTTPTKHKSTDTPNTSRFAVLDGKRIFLPYGPGNMPELVLKMFSHTTNIYPDIRYSGSTIEAANLLQHEQNTYALLPEPAATLILGKEKQRSTVRLFTLEELWMEHFPGQTAMPTAALIMVGPLLQTLIFVPLSGKALSKVLPGHANIRREQYNWPYRPIRSWVKVLELFPIQYCIFFSLPLCLGRKKEEKLLPLCWSVCLKLTRHP